MFDYLRFRLQRQLRRFRRELRQLRLGGNAYLQQHIVGKWRQLGIVRRLILSWWGIMLIGLVGTLVQVRSLRTYYQVLRPVPGGQYIEGELGQIKSINPVLPDNQASADVTRLVFSGLTRIGPDRKLTDELASSWSTSADGKTYTFNLRHDIKWHDGAPFTATDVVFTLTLIQNPDTRSPLAASWQGVKAVARDDYTVVYTLPNPYAGFPFATTVGILPSHLLSSSDPALLRSSSFNQHPVGTGPFKLKTFSTAGEVVLAANANYFRGRPKLDLFSFKTYASERKLLDAYNSHQLTALSRVRPEDLSDERALQNLRLVDLSLNNQVDLFMHTTTAPLNDKAVRTAIAQAVNRQAILHNTQADRGLSLTLPLMPGQVGYTSKFQPQAYDAVAARAALVQAGWQFDHGVLLKGGQPLKLNLVTVASYHAVAAELKRQLKAVGVQLEVHETDVTNLQQSYIKPRQYDLLLYGINIGPDPDVYAFWHSSQATDPGLNLSQYSNANADKALESARITGDADVRSAKYGSFLANWVSDEPAVVLFRPDYIYAVNPRVHGLVAQHLVEPADRFYGVEQWTVKTVPLGRGI